MQSGSRHRPALAGRELLLGIAAFAIALVVAGCSGDGPSEPDVEAPLDISTPRGALVALSEYWGDRDLAEAKAMISTEYRFYPIDPAEIDFLDDGETSWGYEQEVQIMEEVLVPERSTWLDQVLLEIRIDDITTLGNGHVEVEATTELLFTTLVDLERSRSDMVYELEVLGNGDYRIVSERETARFVPSPGDTTRTVGVQKSTAFDDRTP